MADKPKAASTHPSSRNNASIRSRAIGTIPATLNALNSLNTDERRAALTEAVNSFHEGVVVRPQDTGWVNVLARTFFSYSADGYSPTRLAWEAVIRGLSIIGSADVDNLGALGEMYAAGDALGIRTTVSMESKAYVLSYGNIETNCPGEAGLTRVLGVGFPRVPELSIPHGQLIASLPNRARARHITTVEKFNAMLAPVQIDYQTDVLPLTPAGNASHQHIAAAYANKARQIFPELPDLAVFWADVLGRSPKDAEELLTDNSIFMGILSEKLTRMMGEWDLHPSPDEYPAITDFFKAIIASGAVPCLIWRDGLSAGEANPEKLLDDAVNWGARAVALTPDMCWNIPNPGEKSRRQQALADVVDAARKRSLPLLVGSTMSSPKQKFVDSFDAPEMSLYFRDFTDSAFWLYGHTILERSLGIGAASEWAATHFRGDRSAANAFYTEAGKKAQPGRATRARLASAGAESSPGDVLDALSPLRL